MKIKLFKHRGALLFAVIIIAAFSIALFWGAGSLWQPQLSKIQNQQSPEHRYDKLISKEDAKALPEPKNSRSVKIPILMYHHIAAAPKDASPIRKDLTVSVENFENQVSWLKQEGYSSIKLADVYQYSLGKFTLPKKPVIFTFDDGYLDVFQNAIPILKKYGFTGSFAIITGYPEQQQGDNFYAGWQDIAKAFGAGNEIVSHTQNHFDGKNPKYSADFILRNLSGSINDINEHLGFTTNILIYPYGHYTADYIKQARTAGFIMGITVHEGSKINLDNLMEVPRLRVHGSESLERFKELILE